MINEGWGYMRASQQVAINTMDLASAEAAMSFG